MSRAYNRLQKTVVDRVKQRLAVLTEAGRGAVVEVTLSADEIGSILRSLGEGGGGLSRKLQRALKTIANYERMGARSGAELDAYNDYMSGGYGLGVPKRMMKKHAERWKEQERAEARKKKVGESRKSRQSLTEDAGAAVPVELTYDELNHIINAISHYGSDTKKFPGRMSPAGIMKKLRMAFHSAHLKSQPESPSVATTREYWYGS